MVTRVIKEKGNNYEITPKDGCWNPNIVNRVHLRPITFQDNQRKSHIPCLVGLRTMLGTSKSVKQTVRDLTVMKIQPVQMMTM